MVCINKVHRTINIKNQNFFKKIIEVKFLNHYPIIIIYLQVNVRRINCKPFKLTSSV